MEVFIMPTIKNMRELENAIMQTMNDKFPEAIEAYCQKWYNEHQEIQSIVSEGDFIIKAKESLKMRNDNGKFKTEFAISWDEDIYNANREMLDKLKADFESYEFVNEIMDFIWGRR